MPFVALFASAGRGYLPPLAWALASFILAQLISVLGWGDWFPWSVPVLLSGMYGPQGAGHVGLHSYILVLLALLAGLAATFTWWWRADQVR
jgi:ABC-2 type transport system permease protein